MSARDLNRRAAPRYPVEYAIRVQSCTRDSTVRVSGCSRDISARGIQLRSIHPIPLGTRIVLTLEHSDGNWEHVSSSAGIVVWVTPVPGQGSYLLGIHCDAGENPLMAYSWTARPPGSVGVPGWTTDPLTGLALPTFFLPP